MKTLLSSLRMLLVLTALTGLGYPLAVTAVGQSLFPVQAGGSLIDRDGVIVGSALIGQATEDPRYFQPRPSAIGYNPLPSGGVNQSATSLALQTRIDERVAALRAANPTAEQGALPGDLLTASGSGLDPHISPEAARLQIPRIAAARGFDRDQRAALEDLVERRIEPPTLGFLGVARINVLALNLELDGIQ